MVRRPALALLADSLGANPFMVGLVVALSTVTGIFLKLPMGLLSDVLNRQRLMIAGVLAFAIPPFFYPFISDLSTLGILRLIHGLATAMFTPLALAMVGDWFVQQRGEAFGWYTSATQGGGLLGPMIGGIIVYQYGFSPAFLLAGVFGILALFFFWLIPQSSSASSGQEHSFFTLWPEMREGLRRVCQSPPILLTSLVEAAKMVGNGTLMAFLPLYGLFIGLNAAEIGSSIWRTRVNLVCLETVHGAGIRSGFASTIDFWWSVLVCVNGDADPSYPRVCPFTSSGRSIWLWRSSGNLFHNGIWWQIYPTAKGLGPAWVCAAQ